MATLRLRLISFMWCGGAILVPCRYQSEFAEPELKSGLSEIYLVNEAITYNEYTGVPDSPYPAAGAFPKSEAWSDDEDEDELGQPTQLWSRAFVEDAPDIEVRAGCVT